MRHFKFNNALVFSPFHIRKNAQIFDFRQFTAVYLDMAINQNGFLRGQVGNLVNRKLGSINVIQTKAGRRIKQSEGTKECSHDFGVASRASFTIRFGLIEIHQNLYDGQMINRLNKQIYRALRSNPDQVAGMMSMDHAVLSRLVGFQFNEKNHMEDYLFLDPKIHLDHNQQLHIQLPEFDIIRAVRMPKKCDKIIMHFQVVDLNFPDQSSEKIKSVEFEMEDFFHVPIAEPQHWIIDCHAVKNKTILVGLNIHYISQHTTTNGTKEYLLNTKDFNTAAIISAFKI
ncbi:hypothetical protein LZQ00_13470 [Sphingobacterium sp. SRCM116780]|uniref:hypothetical protein n=1 Tax=Sphingobacterium sp. SRCM116780 TaxID=2907623 RepID=UPI001F4512B3|nr:hypothetical protein [Sphingobacterium sp. SRCM116780]UIR55277.1 hypothetical protein LZQ00_13470 [Sphingobacterium sp. SRCM116780]